MGQVILLVILNIIGDVLVGIWAWNIVDPYDFWEGLLFLLLWSVFAFVVYWVSFVVAGVLTEIFK